MTRLPTMWGGGPKGRWGVPLGSTVQTSPSSRGALFFSSRIVDRDDAAQTRDTPPGEGNRERQEQHEGGHHDGQRVGQVAGITQPEEGEVAAGAGCQRDDEGCRPNRPDSILAVQGSGADAGEPEQPPGREPVENQSA